MLYTSLTLKGLTRLRVIHLEQISLEFSSRNQVIIGTNGSGKTSILNQMTPLPPAKPKDEFSSDGYKELKLFHDGHKFILISDYGNKNKTHSFIMDDDDLNPSGNASIQRDCVEKYLGYTKELDSLLSLKTKICGMGPSIRKTWLMNLAPYNLNFILDDHKHVLSQIRACKNNLQLLIERKANFDSQLITDDDLVALKNTRSDLNKSITVLTETLIKMESWLSNQYTQWYRDAENHEVIMQSDWIKDLEKTYLFHMRLLGSANMNLSSLDDDKLALSIEGHKLSQEIVTKSQELNELTSSITNYDLKIATLTDAGSQLTHLNDDIENLANLIKTKANGIIPNPLPKLWLENKDHHLDRLNSLIDVFKDLKITPSSIDRFKRKRKLYSQWDSKVSFLESHKRSLENDYTSLKDTMEKRHSMSPPIPIEQCQQYNCPLFLKYKEISDDRQLKFMMISKQYKYISSLTRKLRLYLEHSKQWLDEQSRYFINKKKLVDWLTENNIDINLDVLESLLLSNPHGVIHRVEDHITQSVITYDHDKLQKEFLELNQNKLKIETLNIGQLEVLTELQKELQVTHTSKKLYLDTLYKKEKEINGLLDRITLFSTLKSDMLRFIETGEDVISNALKYRDMEFVTEFMKVLKDVKDAHISQLGEIDQKIKQQDILKAQNEEIMSQLSIIETMRSDYILIEKALNPNGISQIHTAHFLNCLIKMTNIFIAYVFNYTLELKPIGEGVDIDFTFKVKVKDITSEDVDDLSDAQKEIVDLCFNLAILVCLGLTDYPIRLDEIGKTFDPYHKQKLLDLLKIMIDDNTVSQLFLINHNTIIHEGLGDAEILVLDKQNITTPAVYNTHVEIIRS